MVSRCVASCGSRRLLALSSVGLLVLPLAGVACKEEPPPSPPVRAIQWIRVEDPATEQARMISGLLRAKHSTDLNFDVTGLVTSYKAELGDSVKKQQVLAELDKEPFILNVRKGQGEVAKAKAGVVDANADYRRVRLLYEADNASKNDLDNVRAQLDTARGLLRTAESQLGTYRRDLREATLRAPYDGTISKRSINVGQTVQRSTTVYTLDGTETGLQVQVDVPESLIDRVKQGQTVEVRFPANKQTTQAVVSEVGTRAGRGNAFPVKADLVEDLPWARPGMTAEVTFTYGFDVDGGAGPPPEGVMIPIDAVLPAGEMGDDTRDYYVFVFDESASTVRKTAIKGGGIRDNRLNVIEGLKTGDVIASAGVEHLNDGQQVTLYKPERY